MQFVIKNILEHVSVSVQKLSWGIQKSHRVRQTGCKLHRTEPVLQVVILHALVVLKIQDFFVISVENSTFKVFLNMGLASPNKIIPDSWINSV